MLLVNTLLKNNEGQMERIVFMNDVVCYTISLTKNEMPVKKLVSDIKQALEDGLLHICLEEKINPILWDKLSDKQKDMTDKAYQVVSDVFKRLKVEEYYQPSRKRFIKQVFLKERQIFDWITMETTTPEKYDLLKACVTKKAQEESKQTGKEIVIEMQKNLRKYPFCKRDIITHLRQEETIGIYTIRDTINCFMTYDIDVIDEEMLQKVWGTLNKFGIEDAQILARWSGNKGCHITIFFDDFIDKRIIENFFDIIIYEANLEKKTRENGMPVIELRGASGQGVKIPFGINKKNSVTYKKIRNYNDYERRELVGKGSYCYLINKYMGEIDIISKIESMQKVDKKFIEQIVEDYECFMPPTRVENKIKTLQVEQVAEEFDDLISDVDISKLTNNKEAIEQSIEKLITRPIVVGTRHDTLFKIAVYNKSKGMTQEENIEFLLEFSTQDRHQYKATAKENRSDIKSLIKTIYMSKNSDMYRIRATAKEVFFSREDIEEILSVEKRSLRKLYFVLILHVKMYHNFKRASESEFIHFYCGYERLAATLKIDNKSINKRLIELQEIGKLEFIRKGVYQQVEYTLGEAYKTLDERKREMRKEANIYQLNYRMQDIKEGYKLLCQSNKYTENITYVNFQFMCSKVFTKKEIAKYFKGTEAVDIKKYKFQATRAVG